jgi:hypothetical protein
VDYLLLKSVTSYESGVTLSTVSLKRHASKRIKDFILKMQLNARLSAFNNLKACHSQPI